jgi:hypothetical protein
MKTRGLGRSIMAAAVACFFIFILLAMSGRFQGGRSLLLYVTVVALALGAILFGFGIMKGGKQ